MSTVPPRRHLRALPSQAWATSPREYLLDRWASTELVYDESEKGTTITSLLTAYHRWEYANGWPLTHTRLCDLRRYLLSHGARRYKSGGVTLYRHLVVRDTRDDLLTEEAC